MSLRVLYCYSKKIFNGKNGVYYSINAYFFRKLSQFFEKMYFLAPVADFTKQLRRFDETPQLKVVKTRGYRNRVFWCAQKYFWSFQSVFKFKEWQDRADVVVLTIPSAITYLAFLPLINKPLVVQVVGDEQEVFRVSTSLRCKIERFSRFLKFRELTERYLLRKANAIICRNIRFKHEMAKRYGLSESKISVITPGIDTSIFTQLDSSRRQKIKKKLELKANDLIIGFVAMYISRAKGADILIKAFSRLRDENPHVKLLLIGNDKLGFRRHPSIIYRGPVNKNELPYCYNAMDIFVFPSRSDSAPKAVMEAFACGVPVVASNVGAIPDWIKEGENGFLTEPDDVDRIISCCRRLLKNEELRIKIGKNARKYAVRNFDLVDLAKKNADIIKGNI